METCLHQARLITLGAEEAHETHMRSATGGRRLVAADQQSVLETVPLAALIGYQRPSCLLQQHTMVQTLASFAQSAAAHPSAASICIVTFKNPSQWQLLQPFIAANLVHGKITDAQLICMPE